MMSNLDLQLPDLNLISGEQNASNIAAVGEEGIAQAIVALEAPLPTETLAEAIDKIKTDDQIQQNMQMPQLPKTTSENSKKSYTNAKNGTILATNEKQAKAAESLAFSASKAAKYQTCRAKRVQMDIRACHHRIDVETEIINALSQKVEAIPKLIEAYLKAETIEKNTQPKKKTEKNSKKPTAKVDNNEDHDTQAMKIEVEKSVVSIRQAKCETKKAKLELEEAKNAKELLDKHRKVLAKVHSELKLRETELENREAIVKARTLQAAAKKEEANALRKGNTEKAEEKKKAASLQRSIIIEKEAELRENNAKENPRKSPKKKERPVSQFTQRRARLVEKKHLSAKGLLEEVHTVFQDIPSSDLEANQNGGKNPRKKKISLCDCLMSGLAVFALKYPSLLQFDQDSREGGCIKHNLKALFKIKNVPSDTCMRERLDDVDPETIRPAFKKIFAQFQRGKDLERYVFLDGHYLVSGDGTGYFSSNTVHCSDCCEKCHKDGHVSYYHQLMSAVIVHPDHPTVIPFCPEPITHQDGSNKNDCERNASERLYRDIRREHPHLPLIVTEDALGSNGPHIKLLNELNMRFIIVVKEDGNKSIFEFLKGIELDEVNSVDSDGKKYKIRFMNDIPLNDANKDIKVNFFELWVYDKNGEIEYHNSWITDFLITKQNVYRLSQGGRAKWKIENEAFNTLKNQEYHFEHNFGHGFNHLSTILAFLMFLAFTIDQIQQFSCGLFQAALEKMGSRVRLWGKMKSYFIALYIDSWEDLWKGIIYGIEGARLKPLKPLGADTS